MADRSAGGPAASTARAWLPALLLVAATLAFYQPVWHAGFIWDDDDHLTENPCVVGPLGVKEIWTTRDARICPLVQTTWWLGHKLWGLNPLPYHILNVLVHAAGAIVFWRLLRILKVRGAWLGAAIWALHPVQVETVAWITELKNTQSALFFLLAALFFSKSMLAEKENGKSSAKSARTFFLLSIAMGFMAMASKSSTVVLPVALGLCAWWIERRWRWNFIFKLAPFILLAAAASALSIWTQQLETIGEPAEMRSLANRFIVSGKVLWFYLCKFAWPRELIFVYPRWEIDTAQALSYLPALAGVALLGILWWYRRGRGRAGFFAFTYFGVALAPVMGLVDHYFLRYSFVGDHFQYLASLGAAGIAGAGLAVILERTGIRGRPAGNAAIAALLLVLGILTWNQTWKYRDNESLWRHTIEKNPDAWLAQNNLGILLKDAGRLDEAIDQFHKSIAIDPNHPKSHANLGSAFYEIGRYEDSVAAFRKALEIRPGSALDHSNIGNTFVAMGRFDEAITHLRMSLRIEPNFPTAAYNLGNAFLHSGRPADAIEHYRHALKLNPGSVGTRNNLGIALLETGQAAEARRTFEEALRLEPDNVDSMKNLAWTLATAPEPQARDGNRAVALGREASRRTGGHDPNTLRILAAALAEAGSFPEAASTARQAVDLATAQGNSALADQIRQEQRRYASGRAY